MQQVQEHARKEESAGERHSAIHLRVMWKGQQVKRTPWFSGQVFPSRVGWYEVRFWIPGVGRFGSYTKVAFDYWDGVFWCQQSQHFMGVMEKDQWRGLTEQA